MKEMLTAIVMSAVLITGTARYTPAKAGPSMATNIITLNKGVTLEQCLKKAAFKFKEANITENIDLKGNSLYAESGDYTAHVRCAVELGFVYFVVAGPDSSVALKGIEAISNNF